VPVPGHFSAAAGVVAFTVVHCALWIGIGTLAVRAVRAAARTPAALVLAINLTIGLEVAFAVFAGMLAADGMGAQAWRAVFVGSLVGSAATWWYLVRQHPELRVEYARAAADDRG
jgi:hypothetical protein